jgi:hypothetical protein
VALKKLKVKPFKKSMQNIEVSIFGLAMEKNGEKRTELLLGALSASVGSNKFKSQLVSKSKTLNAIALTNGPI